MKKLLVTAIGAAAAFGAFAGEISRQAIGDFASTGPVTTNDLNTTLGNYWSEPEGATNTYTVSTLSSVGQIATPIDPISGKALDVKTTFGKPLSVNLVSGGSTNIPNSGIYFDSLVKFTVCEDTPTETYDGAKIIMWLQEQYDGSDNVTGTNLMVRAGYLSYNAGLLPPVAVTPTNYVCTFGLNGVTGDFADKWHRVTIKAIPDITTGTIGEGVPGFAIYIDGSGTDLLSDVNSNQAKWDSSFDALALNEGAKWLNDRHCLFPSMVQSGGAKGSLTSASFDGTGSITDIVFTDEPMAFAADYVAPKANVTIGSGEPVEYGTLAEAVAALSGLTDGQTGTLQLMKGMTVAEPLTINADYGTVVLDFAGCVLTNTVADAMITNNAALLVVTNSVGNGGIYCTDTEDGTAIYNDGGLTFTAGVIDGLIIEGENSSISDVSGGSFRDQTVENYLAEGKILVENQVTGLYDVVDYVAPTYTVKFISGEGSTTNEYTEVDGEEVTVPTPAAVAGKSFSAWDPAIAGATVTVKADVTYEALYTNNIYTITFVIGESSSSVQKEYGSEITSVPEIPVRPGYTGAWDDDPAGDTVTGDKTYTYTYSAETYTITYMYGANALTGLTPATYTVENAVTLPTEVNLGVTGVSFESWTNAEGTVVANWAAGAKTGNQTFYAKTSAVVSPTIFDGGDGSSFDIPVAKQEEIAAVLPSGKAMSDAVSEGSSMTYAQAYALGLLNETTGAVDELDATIELKDGKVVVNLSSAPKSAYTVTLKVYEKQSLTAAWPVSPTQTYTLDDPEATTGFTPSGSGSGFYKTEVTISNK